MLSEYKIDYSKAKPNRFHQTEQSARPDVDVARMFPTSEAVK